MQYLIVKHAGLNSTQLAYSVTGPIAYLTGYLVLGVNWKE